MRYEKEIETELSDDIFDEDILEDFFVDSKLEFNDQKVRLKIICEEI